MCGFTLPEVIIVIGIISLLLAYVITGYIRSVRTSTINGEVQILLAHIANQQNKAMSGSAENNASPSAYGIYFSSSSYTLFQGDSYNSTDPDNIAITVPNTIRFTTIQLPQQSIVFQRLNGEVQGFSPSQNLVVVQEENTIQKVMTINRFGVIDIN